MTTKIGLKVFREEYNKKFGCAIDVHLHKAILSEFNDFIATSIINGREIKLAYGIGKLYVSKHIPKSRLKLVGDDLMIVGKYIDFGATRKLRREINPTWTDDDWKSLPKKDRPVVTYSNEHTEGYRYVIQWDKNYAVHRNSSVWAFRAVRGFKRNLAARLKEDNKPTYYEQKSKLGRDTRKSKEGSSTVYRDK